MRTSNIIIQNVLCCGFCWARFISWFVVMLKHANQQVTWWHGRFAPVYSGCVAIFCMWLSNISLS